MTTSSTMSLSSVTSLEDKAIPPFELGYLKAAVRDEAHESFLNAFIGENSTHPHITRAFIARRAGKSPEQISRLLASPGNWTFDTYATLCAAIGYKPTFGMVKISDLRWANECHPLAASCIAPPVFPTTATAPTRNEDRSSPNQAQQIRPRMAENNLEPAVSIAGPRLDQSREISAGFGSINLISVPPPSGINDQTAAWQNVAQISRKVGV